MATDKAPERASSRVILHCDCNNFFASVELLSHPELHDKPVAVAGDTESRHGIILAKNMIAKRFGVKTAETVWQARQKCPGLVLLPPHHDRYVAFSERINRIYLDYTDQVEPFSVDESFLDVTGSRALFGSGKEIADTLRKRIREEIGITISAGVSFNKTWAKMGSDYKKPDATTVISRENAEEILYPQPIENMLYVGASAAQVLKRNGITTIGHLAAASPDALFRMLGKSGLSLSRAARGADESPVRVYGDTDEARSISNSRTYPRDLVGQAECEKALLALSESVGTRLRAHGLKCRTVQVQIKDSDLKVISRQRTLSLPTSSTDRIYREACAILAASWPENRPVRLFSVGVDHLTGEDEQMPVQ
ncbi:MAG: DNA polymerase IV, partial [Clostridia bacterium]|nr:DNA polymerase IV [Clostridia bacterium]